MKIYNISEDHRRFLIDQDRGSTSGQVWELELEMKLWNFVARIVNWLFHKENIT